MNSAHEMASMAQLVLDAHERIRSSVVETPLELIPGLTPGLPVRVLFKLENLQRTGSFKLRGATNKILSLSPKHAQDGVIAASNCNHGLGVAPSPKAIALPPEAYCPSHPSPPTH